MRSSGAVYALLLPAVFDPEPDVVAGVRAFFAGAAEHLRATGYADACPIATAALEVSSTSEPMREACADVFEPWIEAGAQRFTAAGIAPERSRELTTAMIAALEGSLRAPRPGRATSDSARRSSSARTPASTPMPVATRPTP